MRVNLAKDPSLRSGTTNAFTPLEGATLSVIDEYGFYGDQALQVTKSSDNGSGVKIAQPIPVDGGKPYAFSVYSRLPVTIPNTETATLVLQVTWLNALNVTLSTVVSATLEMDDDSQMYRIGGVWTSPANARFADVAVIQILPGTSEQKFILDAFLFEQANYIGGYFDNITQGMKNKIVNKALSAVPQVINGIRLGADISLNGLVLNTIDERDTVWVVTSLDGWWGQTSPELPDISRGTEDGSYDVEGRLSARTIVLEGFFIPKDPEGSLSASIDRLVTASNLVRRGGWLIANENPTKASFVRLANKPEIRTVNARGRTNFTVTLRAGDPIKYHWDDSDPMGFTSKHYDSATDAQILPNIGTSDVRGVFTITGPVGAGTSIYNATTDEWMTLAEPLRGTGLVAKAYEVWSNDGVATIRTTAPHGLRPGDGVQLLNMVIPFSESATTRIVTDVSDVFPYTFSFNMPTDDIELMRTNGQVVLVNNDVLTIDTYDRSVTFNNETVGHRHRLTTLTDWVRLAPGNNVIQYLDDVTEFEVVSKRISNNTAVLQTADPHTFIPGEQIKVNLPVTATLSGKSLENNVVTLTTEGAHGFSVGDSVNVQSTERATVVNKSRTSNVVSITTESPHGVSVGDSIQLSLPTQAPVSTKELESNVATLTSPSPHGFSVGDSVTVAMPTNASIAGKQIANNQATLTTTAPHGFSVGDSITVSMPSGTTVTNKARSGSQVILTTSSGHGFAVGDAIIISLPTARTPVSRSIDPATALVTISTSAAHGYSVGDRISMSVGLPTTFGVTNASATTTTVTLTTNGGHPYSVGEKINVSGVGSRYDGQAYITSVTSNTVTYNSNGSALSSSAVSGTITNITIGSYYNGTKVVESVPTSGTFTYRAWDQEVSTSSAAFSSPSLTNLTNQSYNGTKTLTATTATTFSYSF